MVLSSWLIGAFALIVERRRPGTSLPQVSGWSLRSKLFVVIELLTVVLAVVAWVLAAPGETIGSALDVSEQSLTLQVALNYLLSTFVFYWWHRLRHESDFLWRVTHQFHHSPSRIETVTAFYKHPFEVIADTWLNLALSFLLLGVSIEAFVAHTACIAASQFFVHMNVATPRWVGWFIQRPEMHRIHHEYGVHKNNYADLPLWDMLFGTYRNPEAVSVVCGFETDREARVLDMLALKDVHRSAANNFTRE
jgi:sterol desaturase/sphingolipid hydroxylase (fatty acid hydroxylase superfamily)